MDWQARQRVTQLNLELARLKRERKRIKAEAANKIRQVKSDAAATIGEARAKAEQWIAEIQAQPDGPRNVVAGEWYIAVYCERCLWPIPLLPDVTKGTVALAGSGLLRVRCLRPECEEDADYCTDQAISL